MAFSRYPQIVTDFSDPTQFGAIDAGGGSSTLQSAAASDSGQFGIALGSDSLRVTLDAVAANDQVRVTWDCEVLPPYTDRFCIRYFHDVPLESDPHSDDWNIGFFVGNTAGNYTAGALTRFNFNSSAKVIGNTLVIAKEDMSATGGGCDFDQPIRAMWFEIRKKVGAGTVETYLDSVFAGWALDSVPVAFSFDDADDDYEGETPIGQYGFLWKEIFQPNGWLMTLATTKQIIDGSESLTTAQLLEMYDAGCDVIYHGITHNDHRLTTEGGDFADAAEFLSDIDEWSTWADDLGIIRAREWAAWPFGAFSETTIAAFDTKGFSKYRLAGGGFSTEEQYSYFPILTDAFRSVYDKEVIVRQMSDAATAVALLATVDSAINKQVPMNFYGHVFPTTTSEGREMAKAEADTFFAGIISRHKAGSIKVGQLTDMDLAGFADALLPQTGLLLDSITVNHQSDRLLLGGTATTLSAWGTFDTATIIVQKSDNGWEWRTVTTFTAAGRYAYTPTASTYVRAVVTSVGGSTAVSLLVT